MRRIQRPASSSRNNNQRELRNNLPVIVIDDSTDEDTSILQQTPPRSNPVVRDEILPIAVSDDETTLNPYSPSSPSYSPPPFNSLDWSDADSSKYESSSDEDEAPNHNNIDNILERLTREEERETVPPRQNPPTVVQYNNNRNRNNNYYQPNRMINNHTNNSINNNHSLPFLSNNNNSNSSNNNNSNRNLLHQHRMQSTSASAARIPIQASRRFVTPTASTNNRTPFTFPAHHHYHLPNTAQSMAFTDTPTFERMVEQHILAQVIARSHRNHDVGGAIHPLMFVNRDFDDRDYEMLLALDDNVETTSKKTAASVVGKLPIVNIEEKDCTCSICLEDLEPGTFASEIPFCNHKFHTDCIEKWLKDYGHTCPVCKQEVTEIDFNHAK